MSARALPKDARLTESDFRQLQALAILRLSHAVPGGCARLALQAGCDERTMRNARDGHATLKAPTLFNLLAEHPSALDEMLGAFGLKAVPVDDAGAACAPTMLARVTGLAAAVAVALEDGRIDHVERAGLAEQARALTDVLHRFVAEHDAARFEWGRA